jgi:hypothetical protein
MGQICRSLSGWIAPTTEQAAAGTTIGGPSFLTLSLLNRSASYALFQRARPLLSSPLVE